jgi:hypothetical protein
MGQAKRRKAAGTYPEQRDPEIAIMVAVDDCEPLAFTMPASQVADIAETISPLPADGTLPSFYENMCSSVAAIIKGGRVTGDRATTAVINGAVWTAFNHAIGRESIDSQVADFLRRGETPHITWCLRDRGLTIEVREEFTDLSCQAEDVQKRGIAGPSASDATGKITRTH